MKIYIAGMETIYEELKNYIKNHPTNILFSFYNVKTETENLIPYAKNFLLDSGAFSLFKAGKGKGIDWNKYIESYASFINRNKISHYFELDIDVLVGFKKVLELRKKLEDMTGKQSIPVWHRSRGLENFCDMCENYPYVAIGGMVSDNGGKIPIKVLSYLVNEAHKRNTIIHGLGCTGITKIQKVHFDSVDSSSWLAGNKYGFIYHFDGKTVKHIKVPTGYRLNKDKDKEIRLNNLQEWVKFSEYAEYRL